MRLRHAGAVLLACLGLLACAPQADPSNPFAPGIAGESDIDGLLIGHRLMAAGEYELALKAYTREAGKQGLTVDVLSAVGSANMRLGRLGQAERYLRQAIEKDETFVPAWNNLGVILVERGEIGEAAQVFRRAFALDSGESAEIRDNLRLTLAKLENPSYTEQNEPLQLVRRGTGDYLILSTP
ncbi:tetratricopeptide repeat protein [Nereida sp. MMG025]|uniref:tetratricopeptide repeat protein n=1 Tax=Nereida sp. MMG025 TaxID=2909981 RepID=UPI001F485CB2|nr:tetratricopeptide repeat protein [Nereida sp. MMG025]MCF6444997.1 tetratricopeptide repeat protein [Nereida sp. MMG025]